ncbi:hypothetical protein MNBD_ACTINO01-626, partial [hydrothermal vent metagenome]
MKPPRRIIFTIVPMAIFLLPIAIYLADVGATSDEIARNVTVVGLPVGGLAPQDATLVLEAHQSELRQSSGMFTVADRSFDLNPLTIGLTVATDRAVDDAMLARRDGNILSNFTSWLRSFGSVLDVPLTISFSEDAIDKVLDTWEVAAIDTLAFEGAVTVVDGVVTPEYPTAGDAIDRAPSIAAVIQTMSTLDKSVTPLPITTSQPSLTSDDIDAAAAEMGQMIDSEITLISNEVGVRVSFSPHDLEAAVRADLSDTGDTMIVSFDEHGVLHVI